jgi:hypothetical protein
LVEWPVRCEGLGGGGAARLERLLKVAVLVHVHHHQLGAAREREAEVLVLGLALAQDRHPRQRDPPLL